MLWPDAFLADMRRFGDVFRVRSVSINGAGVMSAELAHAPTDDTGVMLANCTYATVAPAHIDLSQPVVVVAALAGLTLAVLLRSDASLKSRATTAAITVLGVALAGAVAHFAFHLGLESLAAATLTASIASALFPASCSRHVASLVAAASLALGAAVG